MAGEQSTGTFTRVPGETDELRERHAARVEQIDERESVTTPSLPGAMAGDRVPARRGGAFLAAFQHGPIAAQPAGHGGRESVRAEAVLRLAAARSAAAAGIPRALPRSAIRRRRHAPPYAACTSAR